MATLSLLALGGVGVALSLRSDADLIRLRVQVGGRSISKLPFVMARDQGLYRKYGLDIGFELPPPDFEGGIVSRADGLLTRVLRQLPSIGVEPFDIIVDGGTPYMVRRALWAREPTMIQLAGTDCVVRAHIVSHHGFSSLEDLKGKRIGVNIPRATTGFVALLLAEKMGWDPDQDLSIMYEARDPGALRQGVVDAIIASERAWATLRKDGFPVLADTEEWGEALAGNSVIVEAEWLDEPENREAARRFLMATVEGISLFHQDRELALDVLKRWYGIRDPEYAVAMYERGTWIPRAPLPCYEGINRTMALYGSNEMRRYEPEDFYDDNIIRELVESGFVSQFYGGR